MQKCKELGRRALRVIAFLAKIIGALFVLALVAFPGLMYIKESAAVDVLVRQGWTNVEVRTNHWFAPAFAGGCPAGTDTAFRVAGMNPEKKEVKTVVCCTLKKGCALRQ